jgi:predicted site-specific integrase-resolvase
MIEEITIEGAQYIAGRRAASLVGVSPDYLTRWCREGLVHARRLAGGVWFVSLPSVERFLAEKEARKRAWHEQLRAERRAERATFP